MSERLKLLMIAQSGPLKRGTTEWDERELARRALGCRCLSFGSIGDAKGNERYKTNRYFNYHQH